jgi:hypothetical protein
MSALMATHPDGGLLWSAFLPLLLLLLLLSSSSEPHAMCRPPG